MIRARIVSGFVIAGCVLVAASASASAAEFAASKTGSTKGEGTSQEVFKLNPMTIDCLRSTSTGQVEGLKSETLKKVSVKYSDCKTFSTITVTASEASYEYNADGTVRIEEPITFTIPAFKCTITVAAQVSTSPTALFSDITEYGKKAFPEGQQKLGLNTSLKGLSYKASNWPCAGPTKEEQPEEREGEEGKFTGEMKDEVIGGNLTWVK